MDIVTRLKSFLQHNGIANSQFADTCQIPRPTLSQLLNGRNKKVSDEIIGKIHAAYPELNVMWLMFGDGEMFVNNGPKPKIDFAGDATLLDENLMNAGVSDVAPANATHGTQRTISFSGADYGMPVQGGAEAAPQPRQVVAPARPSQPAGASLSQAIESIARTINSNAQAAAQGVAPQRRIVNIMVFFDDNSFESFTPNR